MRNETCINCGGKCRPKNDYEIAICQVCRLRKKHKPRTVIKKTSLHVGIKNERLALEKSAIKNQDSLLMNLANEYTQSQNRKDVWTRMKSTAKGVVFDWFKFHTEGRTQTKEVAMAFKILTENEIQAIKVIAQTTNKLNEIIQTT